MSNCITSSASASIRAGAAALLLGAAGLAMTSLDARAHEAGAAALERPASHEALLQQSAREQSVIVVLFTLDGCPYCEAIRRDQLSALAREARARHLRVVEYEINDRRPFESPRPGMDSPASPADLAEALQVRFAPTVVFLGADGKELAPRLVGYSSPDFYGAYLDQRIATASGQRIAP